MLVKEVNMFWKKEKKEVQSERQLMIINELLKRSFSNVKRWMSEIDKYAGPDVNKLLVEATQGTL